MHNIHYLHGAPLSNRVPLWVISEQGQLNHRRPLLAWNRMWRVSCLMTA